MNKMKCKKRECALRINTHFSARVIRLRISCQSKYF